MKNILALIMGVIMLVGFATPAGSAMGYINRQTIMMYDNLVSGDEVDIRTQFDGQEKEYLIIINSLGGSVFACMSIINHIKSLQDSGAKVSTEISGLAASAGAIIWLAGDIRIVHRSDVLMFHGVQILNEYTRTPIPDDQLDKGALFVRDVLNKFMVEMLTELVGEKKAKSMIKGEIWLTGQDAYDMGLATILK